MDKGTEPKHSEGQNGPRIETGMSRKDKEIGRHQQEQHRAIVHPNDALRLVEAIKGVDILKHDGVSPEDEEDAGLQ